ncbi:MAG: hypothetical protein OEQ47_07560 [Acidimicrobiia bacterium]|nr:hypothetical protein [Acidimicrobiia bacterium]
MTDRDSEGQPEAAEAASGIGGELSSTMAKLGASEKLAVLGAAGVMLVWLLFDLLIDEYGIGEPSFILAGLVVAAAYFHHNRGSDDWSVDYVTVVKVAGIFLGLLGAWTLVEQVRGGILDSDATSIIAAIGYYVGTITSGVGAWQMKRG